MIFTFLLDTNNAGIIHLEWHGRITSSLVERQTHITLPILPGLWSEWFLEKTAMELIDEIYLNTWYGLERGQRSFVWYSNMVEPHQETQQQLRQLLKTAYPLNTPVVTFQRDYDSFEFFFLGSPFVWIKVFFPDPVPPLPFQDI